MAAPASPEFLSALAARLPPGTLRSPEPRHLSEPRGRWQGQGAAVACPAGVAEVAAILAAAHAVGVGVVPWGGGTGLVGGQVAPDGPVPLILSTERMAAIRAVHPAENVILAEAGATLAAVQAAAEAAGRIYPLSLASEGTATVGGTLATNAGGTGVLRYGNARDLCLGIEAVMADGTVWHGLRRLRKDNTGYDLRNLLIGSEGTLAVITAASLRMFPPPAGRAVAMIAVPSPAAALRLLHLAGERLPGLVSAFELIARAGFDFLAETMPGLRAPFDVAPEWTVLLELGLPAGMDPVETMGMLHADAEEQGLAGAAVMAMSEAQADHLWQLRESIPEANRRIGAVSSHDIALPLSEVPGFIESAGAALAAIAPFRINCFGHLGDGNLHYNIFPPGGGARAAHDGQRGRVARLVHDMVHARGGSVSAEHGIGRMKVDDLERYGDPVKLAAMRAVKAALDPRGILNPGAVLKG
ncbi:MAG: FAD-binding oxidoreductase [Paracoccaceae bacterium]|nr:MAG: FAD-binding oxidoreductase [Paracoccaceae bacterium]